MARNSHLPMNSNPRMTACGRPYRENLLDPTKPVCRKCEGHTVRAVTAEKVSFTDGNHISEWQAYYDRA